MSDNVIERFDIVAALRVAHDEIAVLRDKVRTLEPKAHAYDTIAQVTRLSIHQEQQSYGEDALWRIRHMIDRLIHEREAGKGGEVDG